MITDEHIEKVFLKYSTTKAGLNFYPCFKNAVHELEQMQWTKVEDGLPIIGTDTSQEFLCLTYDNEQVVLSFITDGDGDGSFYMDYRGHFDNLTENVMAYRNLPEPPKGEL